ncbi:MAG: hypothetical protein Q7J07_00315 [Pelolinea sp.]|nr:hypothetical protein [Pelolinea sp.]
MMDYSLINIIIVLHLALVGIYALLIYTRRSSLSPVNILPILCIPFFGIISALIADYVFFSKKQELDTTNSIETLTLSKDIYWKSIKKRKEAQNVVPLEEALIINDRQTRKELIFETLLEDPMKNIDILLLARENNDVDTAHYANTTIAKIQRDFQLKVQKLAVDHEADPNDAELLDNYIETLGNFIDSGLSEAFLLKRQRIVYADLLDKKIDLDSLGKDTLRKKIKNCLALKDINTAMEANDILKNNFPEDEQTWINALRISVAGHDALRLKETINEVNSRNIGWSLSGKEQISTWVEV